MTYPLRVVTGRTFEAIHCPTCRASHPQHLVLIEPQIQSRNVHGVSEAGDLLISDDAEFETFPGSLLPPAWLFCRQCGTDFHLPAGVKLAYGVHKDASHLDPERDDARRLTQEAVSRPLPALRAKAAA